MVFGGIKKWEICVILAVLGISAVVGSLKVNIPFWVVAVIYVPFAAVMFLWRPVMLFVSTPKLLKHGERAEAVVTEYRREEMELGGSGTAEIIRYSGKDGTKYERPLFTMPMLTRRVGRRYTVYFDPGKEDAFIIVPQSFIAAALWVMLFVLLSSPFWLGAIIQNGG